MITHFVDRFYAFKITASGVVSTPVISQIGPTIPTSGYRRNSIGYMKASPDGSRIAVAHEEIGSLPGGESLGTGMVRLYDFDVTTGVVSNDQQLVGGVSPYGVEFSSDSKKLYTTYRVGVTPSMAIGQFDLDATDIPASQIKVFEDTENLYALQLGPNGKIYCAVPSQNALGVIQNPEVSGTGCNFVINGQSLSPNTWSTLGLPPFITSFFNAAFDMEHFCLGEQTSFEMSNTQNVVSVVWDFGDGSFSSDLNPTHTYAAPGQYGVTLTATTATDVSSASRQLTIYEVPVAQPIPDLDVCAPGASTTVNLSASGNIAIGTQGPSFQVAFFNSLADATSGVNALSANVVLAAGTHSFFAKVFHVNNPKCFDVTSFSVHVYLQPVANAPTPYILCDDAGNDGLATFQLSGKISEIMGNQDPAMFSVAFFGSQSDADSNTNSLPATYQNVFNPESIFVRIQNNAFPGCYATTQFQIGVSKLPVANLAPTLERCDEGNDGSETFDLSGQNSAILSGQSASDFEVTYHLTLQEAVVGTGTLANNYTNSVNPQTIYVRLTNRTNANCFDTTSFEIHAVPKPVLQLPSLLPLCEGTSITLSAPTGFDTYLWSTGQVSNSIVVAQPGTYSVTVGYVYATTVCETSASIVVENSNAATFTGIEIGDWTDNHNTITILVSGDGDYEYSLDGNHYQASNEFSNLIPGEYTVYVNDTNGCGEISETVYLLMYPKFFTPNGDGINDHWQIKMATAEPDLEVLIFDRFGKIITSVHANDKGWDGTFNGKPLPATDYWFVAKRQNGKEYRGHFSLKR